MSCSPGVQWVGVSALSDVRTVVNVRSVVKWPNNVVKWQKTVLHIPQGLAHRMTFVELN